MVNQIVHISNLDNQSATQLISCHSTCRSGEARHKATRVSGCLQLVLRGMHLLIIQARKVSPRALSPWVFQATAVYFIVITFIMLTFMGGAAELNKVSVAY